RRRLSEATRWAAVVVNYNAGEHLVPCVRSLLADTSAGGPPELVVVDNCSSDGSIEELRDACPDVKIVRATKNRGYGAGANLGVGATSAPIVAICNPDLIAEPGIAAALTARFDREPDLGALGPTVRNPDGSVYPSARRLPDGGEALGHAVFGWIWSDNP